MKAYEQRTAKAAHVCGLCGADRTDERCRQQCGVQQATHTRYPVTYGRDGGERRGANRSPRESSVGGGAGSALRASAPPP